MKSKRPSKQRVAVYRASLHKRQGMMVCKIDKAFAKEIGKKRIGVRKGDEVKVMRGDKRGHMGKVARADLKKLRVYLENLKRRKVSGEESAIPLHPSNIMIMKGDMGDVKRQKFASKKVTK